MAKRTIYRPKNIKPRECPRLIYKYEPVTGSGPLHIADKQCDYGPHQFGHEITRCGRVMYPEHEYNGKRELTSFRLCGRCGQESDFVAAFDQAKEWWKDWSAKQAAQREQEHIERETKWANTVSRVKALAVLLVDAGFRVGVKNGAAIMEHDGYEYKVTEAGPIPEVSNEEV